MTWSPDISKPFTRETGSLRALTYLMLNLTTCFLPKLNQRKCIWVRHEGHKLLYVEARAFAHRTQTMESTLCIWMRRDDEKMLENHIFPHFPLLLYHAMLYMSIWLT